MKQVAKYPFIRVKMTVTPFALLNNIINELKRHKVSAEDRKKFFDDATSGNYDNLLKVCKEWVIIT